MRFILTGIFIISTAFLFCQEAVFYVRKPAVKFPRTMEGKVIEHTFIVENRGSIPLTILGYDVECSCTKVEYPEGEIAPGAKIPLILRFDTNGKYGYQDRVILLQTNTKKGIEELRFEVNVRSEK